MVEVLYSVAILSIALLGVMSAITYGLTAADSAGNFSTASRLGREIVEVIRTNPISLPLFGPPPSNALPASVAPAGLIDTGGVNQMPRRRLADAPLNNPVFGLNLAPDGGQLDRTSHRNIQVVAVRPGFLNRVHVRVYWEQNGKEKFVETVAYLRNTLR